MPHATAAIKFEDLGCGTLKMMHAKSFFNESRTPDLRKINDFIRNVTFFPNQKEINIHVIGPGFNAYEWMLFLFFHPGTKITISDKDLFSQGESGISAFKTSMIKGYTSLISDLRSKGVSNQALAENGLLNKNGRPFENRGLSEENGPIAELFFEIIKRVNFEADAFSAEGKFDLIISHMPHPQFAAGIPQLMSEQLKPSGMAWVLSEIIKPTQLTGKEGPFSSTHVIELPDRNVFTETLHKPGIVPVNYKDRAETRNFLIFNRRADDAGE